MLFSIKAKRNGFVSASARGDVTASINDFWVEQVGDNLYNCWSGTPWDFNGTTTIPKKGAIACGYFVTTVLSNMGLKINRTKLAICTSMEMMQNLVGKKKIMNLSSLSADGFDKKIKELGKGVYIIGLDFHTGFIVNDGVEIWFIHSNYINRTGVTKEAAAASQALQASKTKWAVSLSQDKAFQQKWLQ